MNEADTRKDGTESPLADDELAEFERAMESERVNTGSDTASILSKEHGDAYRKIDLLAAPIRSAVSAVDEPPLLPHYEALTEIGRGGMGIVYRAFNRKTQRHDAIKVVRRDCLAGMSSDTVKLMQLRFQQESKLAARVAHEHIVPIYEVGEIEDQPWFSMQLVEGESLRALAHEGGVAPERAVRYVEAIAHAIDAVHRHGIIHGDIKPHNILVESETDRPMISDFGLADFDARYSSDVLRGVVGTPAYMAPELARAALRGESPDEFAAVRSVASDIYSIGATLWSALTGCSPCNERRDARQHLADVANGNLEFKADAGPTIPLALSRIIAKCVAPDPAERYSSAADLADDLSSWRCRPHWNQHFPGLRSLLWMVIAPVLLLSGIGVWWLLQTEAHEGWIWLLVFAGYGPLFATFLASGRVSRAGQQARRELWSIWTGHLIGTFVCMVALRILCHPDFGRTLEFFYPCWAAISSLVFFAKSGNFWAFYRWIAVGWAIVAVLLTVISYPPITFSVFAAITCVVIAKGDSAFLEE
ncbi:serine/threonine protein kinase [Stieleria sp. ICT_E10.1]|uniref:serine/threonine-protein kinase n=1 Tax=Stieleria sedimenti TaxID=2976331 RepID=UPI0021809BB8|nr:serine/threonine-protein kinase [Stieleria sedimenti]MCS7469197.1 serine/threonine protein kinase [Stieleria sedimenti]